MPSGNLRGGDFYIIVFRDPPDIAVADCERVPLRGVLCSRVLF